MNASKNQKLISRILHDRKEQGTEVDELMHLLADEKLTKHAIEGSDVHISFGDKAADAIANLLAVGHLFCCFLPF